MVIQMQSLKQSSRSYFTEPNRDFKYMYNY